MYTLSSIYSFDNTIFDGIVADDINNHIAPDSGINPVVQDVLVNAIMMRCGLLEPIYGEPNVLREMVTYWWKGRAWDFWQVWRAMNIEYNPIENYNRFENSKRKLDYNDKVTDTNTTSGQDVNTQSGKDASKTGGSDKVSAGGQDKSSLSGTDTTRDSGTDTTEGQVSAFNESTYQPKEKAITDYGKTTDVDYGRSDTTQYGKTNTTEYGQTAEVTYGKTDTTQYGKTDARNILTDSHDTDTFFSHIHGNIGVTTSQQMIQSELELRRQNAYEYIAREFESQFCICVY